MFLCISREAGILCGAMIRIFRRLMGTGTFSHHMRIRRVRVRVRGKGKVRVRLG